MDDLQTSGPANLDLVGLKPGEIFWNNYRVIGIIGRGGISTVYKAENLTNKQTVAIKVLHAARTHDEELVRRFVREAQTTTKLDHPHAIRIYEWGVDKNDRPFMIMEFLSGETLSKRIQRSRGLNYNKVVELMEQVCSAMMEAHSLGIIHRDLKPENIMLTSHNGLEDWVKVVDFGIAKIQPSSDDQLVQANLTKTGAILGTPLYMSPEQLRGRKADARSDIYSLGIIAYEMLTGRPPFESKNTAEIVVGHLNVVPEAVTKVRMDLNIPPALNDAVMRAISKNPWERPTTVQEFCNSLLKAIEKPEDKIADAYSKPVAAAAVCPPPAQRNKTRQPVIDPVRMVCPKCRAVTSGSNFRYCLKCGQDNTDRWLPYHKAELRRRGRSHGGSRIVRVIMLVLLVAVAGWAGNAYLTAPLNVTGKFQGQLDRTLFVDDTTLKPALVKKLRFSKISVLLSQQGSTIIGLVTTPFGKGDVEGEISNISPMLTSYELTSTIQKPDGKLELEMSGTYDKLVHKDDWNLRATFLSGKMHPETDSSKMRLNRSAE